MSERTDVCVVIPARGGSKGIQKKNLQLLGGHSLVARSIMQAREAMLVTEVVVSTDDEEIAAEARRYGARVVERPVEISGDTASSESALLHAVDTLQQSTGRAPAVTVLMQCTAPFTTAADIDGTVAPVVEGKAESAFAACLFHHFLWKRDGAGLAKGVNHDGGPRKRRQDLEPQYLEAGSVYAMRTETLRAEGSRFCGRTAIYEVPADHCFEIDTPVELERGRAMARTLGETEADAALPTEVDGIVFDFDGVFTDNAVYVDQEGKESVRCSRGDGMGVELLHRSGVAMVVLSKERNPVVTARCQKLKLPLEQGVDEKLPALKRWIEANKFDPRKVVYVGNDINDLECMAYVGCAVGPADAHPGIVEKLHLRLQATGGNGAVRELADLILRR